MTLHLRKTFAIVAAAAGLFLLSGCSDDSATTTGASTTIESGAAESASGEYKAGEYTSKGDYTTPGGPAEVTVSLTLDGAGTVSAVTVTPEAKGGNSLQFQTQFAGGISDEVVGKSIDDLDVSKVSGSSLTSGGFNQAVEKIRAEASA
ncbi:MAG: FMN-binding protein [Gordonia sp. (in: high G+C Gram-positive bacteria)]|uniref:FMN-binding protein n=1 Tax=Gordonia sp. (in: high G+C Gram-positive bacteria) TaxID=84139 RepID=UPI0039E6A479